MFYLFQKKLSICYKCKCCNSSLFFFGHLSSNFLSFFRTKSASLSMIFFCFWSVSEQSQQFKKINDTKRKRNVHKQFKMYFMYSHLKNNDAVSRWVRVSNVLLFQKVKFTISNITYYCLRWSGIVKNSTRNHVHYSFY